MTTSQVRVEPGGSLPTTWSASAVDGFTQCGLRFWFARVAGWQEPAQEHLAVGNLVHSVLESFYRLDSDQRVAATIPALVDRHVNEALGDAGSLDEGSVREASLQKLRVWWARENQPALINIEPDGLERELRTTIDGTPFVGYVDRVERVRGLWRVVDYKTGRAKPEYMDSKWRQQMLYAAAMEQLGQPVDEVALLFLGDDAAVLTVRPVYDAAIERAVEALTNASTGASAAFDAASWTANSSRLCSYCPFRPACPAHGDRPRPGTEASEQALVAHGLRKRPRRLATPAEARLDEGTAEGLS